MVLAEDEGQNRHDLGHHLDLPEGEAGIVAPRACASVLRAVTANSRPMMMATIQAGARSICTSEMNAAIVSSLSAKGR